VEIVFPVCDRGLVTRLREEILETYWRDNVKARMLHADGSYERLAPDPGEEPLDAQEWFIAYHQRKAAAEKEGRG
jgi:polyphosphate kinase